MQFWFVHRSEVTIREQLVTQVVLGILCDELAPGARLPSTRELARRFRLHPNTISAGYRQLQKDGWVEFRKGSGVYVRRLKAEGELSPALALDRLIANFFHSARDLGSSLPAIRSRLLQWLAMQPPDHFLLIEPDEDLRRIVRVEMQRAVTFPVRSCGLERCNLLEELEGAIPVVLPSKEVIVQKALPPESGLLTLRIRSVPSSLADWLPAPTNTLVGIASCWPDFLARARTMLIAAGFAPDILVLRDARQANWHRGLKETAAVVCDSVTAAELLKSCRPSVFSLLAESSITDLRERQAAICGPIARTL